ncbi:MAG: rod shape-determining protein MreD [Thioalkalispiraceae bacterium]|jgi:rod shape-determining protein MreD
MKLMEHRGGGIIILSFVLALALTIVPLPDLLDKLRPEFVSLTIIYWCMALPNRVGLGSAWTVGLLLDVLRDTLLGQHALALTLVAFFILQLHQRIRVFPLWQQAISIGVLILIQVALVLWIKGIMSEKADVWVALLPVLTTSLFWPPTFLLMRHLRRYYQVS